MRRVWRNTCRVASEPDKSSWESKKCALSVPVVQGEEDFARGEFCGENSAVKKSGEISPRRNFVGTVPSFAIAAEELCFLRRAKRFLRRCMKSGAADPVTGAGGTGPLFRGNVLQFWSLCLGHVLLCHCSHWGVWHLELWEFQGWRNFPLAKLSPAKLSPPLYPSFPLLHLPVSLLLVPVSYVLVPLQAVVLVACAYVPVTSAHCSCHCQNLINYNIYTFGFSFIAISKRLMLKYTQNAQQQQFRRPLQVPVAVSHSLIDHLSNPLCINHVPPSEKELSASVSHPYFGQP